MSSPLAYDDDTAFSLADDAATVSAIVRRAGDRLAAARFDEWTGADIVGHLADTAELFAERVRRCLEEEDPLLPGVDTEALVDRRRRAPMDLMDLSRRLQRAHHLIVELLARPGAAGRTGVHGEWGRVTAAHLGAYHARHSRGHVADLAAAFPPTQPT